MASSGLLESIRSRFCSASKQRANLVSGELQAGVLSTEDISGLACLRPRCVVVAVMETFNWRPQALE